MLTARTRGPSAYHLPAYWSLEKVNTRGHQLAKEAASMQQLRRNSMWPRCLPAPLRREGGVELPVQRQVPVNFTGVAKGREVEMLNTLSLPE